MPEFILDTAGRVAATLTDPTPNPTDYPNGLAWYDLDAFTQGYIEALFFTNCSPAWDKAAIAADPDRWETARSEGQSDGELPGDAGYADLAPETVAAIISECAAFQRENRLALANCQMTELGRDFWYTRCGHGWDADGEKATELGRDFWYTRCGHGCGFWDGDWPHPWGEILTEAADKAGNRDGYMGDDGRVYLS